MKKSVTDIKLQIKNEIANKMSKNQNKTQTTPKNKYSVQNETPKSNKKPFNHKASP